MNSLSEESYLDWTELVRSNGYNGDSVYLRFGADSAEFVNAAFSSAPLDDIASYATNNPAAVLYVIGAINDDANTSEGYELSRLRAVKTASELVSRGVNKEQIKLYAGGSYAELFGYEALSEESARVSVVTVITPNTGTEESGL